MEAAFKGVTGVTGGLRLRLGYGAQVGGGKGAAGHEGMAVGMNVHVSTVGLDAGDHAGYHVVPARAGAPCNPGLQTQMIDRRLSGF